MLKLVSEYFVVKNSLSAHRVKQRKEGGGGIRPF
jgi:hypothetical protein